MQRFLCWATVFWPLLIAQGFSATLDLGHGFADHGVATPGSMPRGTVAAADGRRHPVILSWLMDHRECYELLWLDVLTGKAEEFPLPSLWGDSPFASLLSRSNKFYTHFDYQGEGADVMGVAAAPDGTICGGTCFPMRFFRYDPKADRWTRHAAFGQWNTVARQGDRFFAGVYGGGGLLQWNPSADWVDTEPGQNGCNPAFLTDSAPTINRPHKLLAHPDARTLVLAGTPGYGLTGGGLLFWDRPTATRVVLTHEKLIPQQSTMSLVALPDGKLLGGTTISPGTGGQCKADQAELYLLDLATKRILWHAAAIPGVQNYVDLCLGPDGLVWGFADGWQFFVFDPAARKIVRRETIEKSWGPTGYNQGPRVFLRGPKDTVYVLFQRAIAQIEPEGWKFRLLARPPVTISTGGDYLDGRLYFAAGSHVYSFKPPD